MLESIFVRPQTVDRIRALWLGPAIEGYVGWLIERRNAPSHIRSCVTTLERFNAFAWSRGARTWDDLSAHMSAFVDEVRPCRIILVDELDGAARDEIRHVAVLLDERVTVPEIRLRFGELRALARASGEMRVVVDRSALVAKK